MSTGTAFAAEPGANAPTITKVEQANGTQQYTINNHTNKTIVVSITTPNKRTYSAELAPGESQDFIGDFAGTNTLNVTHNNDRLLYGAVIYNGFGWQMPQFPGAKVDFSQSVKGDQAMLDLFCG